MKYGIALNSLLGPKPDAEDILNASQKAEKLGFHSMMVADHVLIPNALDASAYPAGTFDRTTPWYDPLVMLAAIAGATKTIRLGTGIVVVPYRAPIQQAQAIATLDFISAGRFFYGAGIGWMREEYQALCVPFNERGARTDEYLQVLKLLWSGTGDAFHGRFVDFDGGRINPLPVQKPHPPILIGGETSPALERIARFGDGFYINWKSVDEFKTLLDQLTLRMTQHSRELSSLHMALGVQDIDLVLAQKSRLGEYEALGLDEIVYSPSCSSVSEGLSAMSRFADHFF